MTGLLTDATTGLLPGAVPGSLPGAVTPSTVLTGLPPRAEPPVDIGREEAADAAERELSKGVYHQDDPGLFQAAFDWIIDWIERLLATASENSPGGLTGLLIIIGLIVVAAITIRWRIGPLGRARARAGALVFPETARSAAEHRALAERHAAAGDFDTAVRERFRALVRDLEERTLIDERPSRTAAEAVTEIGRLATSAGQQAYQAARTFEEVCYGGRHANAATYAQVVAADEAVSALRPAGVTP